MYIAANDQVKTYKGIDFFKFIFALLIVYMHTYCFDGGPVGEWIKGVLSAVGVPFFFIASGFFFGKGLKKTDVPKEYLRRYILRITKTYITWTVITFPVAWLVIIRSHNDFSFVLKIVYLIRCFFFSGSIGVYWFLLSLIYDAIIIYCFQKRLKSLFFVASILFLIGVIYNSGIIHLGILHKTIHAIFGSERNFINVGLFYMLVGFYLSDLKLQIKRSRLLFALFVSLFIDTIFYLNSTIRFMQAVDAALFALLALQIDFRWGEKISLCLRENSKALYYAHFPIVLLFDFYLKRGTIIDFCFSCCSCVLLYYLSKYMLPKKYNKMLYG